MTRHRVFEKSFGIYDLSCNPALWVSPRCSNRSQVAERARTTGQQLARRSGPRSVTDNPGRSALRDEATRLICDLMRIVVRGYLKEQLQGER